MEGVERKGGSITDVAGAERSRRRIRQHQIQVLAGLVYLLDTPLGIYSAYMMEYIDPLQLRCQ